MLKIGKKRLMSVAMVIIMLFEPLFCVEAKMGSHISAVQKLKRKIIGLKSFIKNNPKKTAFATGGAGVVTLALILTFVACTKKQSKDDAQGSSEPDDEINCAHEPVVEIKPLLESEIVDGSQLRGDDKTKNKAEVKHKCLTPEERVMNAEVSPKSSGKAILQLTNECIVRPNPSPEEDMFYCLSSLFESDAALGVNTGCRLSARSPSPCGDVIEMDSNLQFSEVKFSAALGHKIEQFCKLRFNVEGVKELIKFLYKIKNDYHQAKNITSVIEANATRCEQKALGFETNVLWYQKF